MKKINFNGIVQRAILDYDMIFENDKLCVGVSGGKDSLACLYALANLRKYSKIPFELEAVTLDLGIQKTDFSSVLQLCENLKVPYHIVNTHIGEIVLNKRKEKSPCSLCANMRRGALNNKAIELGCNKVVLGHTKDDCVDTFMMSLMYEGRINCFSPVTYLSRKNINVIRPLIYTKESQIIEYCKFNKIVPVKSPCPITGTTARNITHQILDDLSQKNPQIRELIFAALKDSSKIPGWN